MLKRLWADMNRRYCEVECYLALNRGEVMVAVEFRRQAMEWSRV